MVKFYFTSRIEEKGIYDSTDEEILINPSKHEKLDDLIDTIEHEYLHYVFESEGMSTYKEHLLIKNLNWVRDEIL